MALTYVQLDSPDKKLYRVHKALLTLRTDEEVLGMQATLNELAPDGYRALRVALAGTVRERKI